jgi:hypothetical protein
MRSLVTVVAMRHPGDAVPVEDVEDRRDASAPFLKGGTYPVRAVGAARPEGAWTDAMFTTSRDAGLPSSVMLGTRSGKFGLGASGGCNNLVRLSQL